ncbi:MAG: phage/plasmid primase, P4 family [Candidatus Acidiferrales bacterium]
MPPKNLHPKSAQHQLRSPNRDGSRSARSECVLKAARAYLRRGFSVVPIPGGANHPDLRDWQRLRITEDDLDVYFADAGGIGLLLEPSGLADVDCDCAEAVATARILLPPTDMVHGHRSNPHSHHYFRADSQLSSKSFTDPRRAVPKKKGRSMLVEMRCAGQTVVPPSVHTRSGELIEWDADGEPIAIGADRLSHYVAQVAAASLLARYWAKGSRHHAALALAGMLIRANWSIDATDKFVLAVATAAKDEETQSRLHDVLTTAQRLTGGAATTGAPTLAQLVGEDIVDKIREWLDLKNTATDARVNALHNTDLGNAKRLVVRHGQNIRFCHSWKQWIVWEGTRWIPDKSDEVVRKAKETVQSIYAEASGVPDEAARRMLATHALKSEAEARIGAIVALAKSEPEIPVGPDELDSDPWLLNCSNGTIDLRTGALLPHRREDLCTKQARVAFDPSATCPRWESFLRRIMADNQSLINFMRRAVGYALTGTTTEQVMFLLYGTGSNGKTTFLETFRTLLGDYATATDFSTFLITKNDDRPRNDIARLKGARFVSAVEAGEGRRLAETVVKQVTGGDTILARFLFREFFEFVPQFKLFLAANHKPRIVGTDDAIWRRIRLVPFTVTIPSEKRDKRLLEKLRTELPGILNWALRGCREWQRIGLGESPEVVSATADFRREMDLFADFLAERCDIGSDYSTTSAEIYREYRQWCDVNGERPLSKKAFGTKLGEQGFSRGKEAGDRCWLGLRPRRRHEIEDDTERPDELSEESSHENEREENSPDEATDLYSLDEDDDRASQPPPKRKRTRRAVGKDRS